MIYLTIALALVVLAAVLLVRSLLDQAARVEAAWQKERAGLLQRIQAPEAAVADHSDAQREPSEENPWLGWDEDPERLTKEELAGLE